MPRATLTAEERAERVKLQRQRHNESRKKAYQNDPERRAAVRDQGRRAYHAANNVQMFDCRANISKLASIGAERKLLDPYQGPETTLTLTTEEMSTALDQSIQVLYRWQRNNLVPAPVMRAEIVNNTFGRAHLPAPQFVYLRDEAEAIMTKLGEHKTRFKQYRTSHTDTTTAIFAAVDAVRARLQFNPAA